VRAQLVADRRSSLNEVELQLESILTDDQTTPLTLKNRSLMTTEDKLMQAMLINTL
jgi:hypothetical protein